LDKYSAATKYVLYVGQGMEIMHDE